MIGMNVREKTVRPFTVEEMQSISGGYVANAAAGPRRDGSAAGNVAAKWSTVSGVAA